MKRMNTGTRAAISLLFLALALLFIGAVRIQDAMENQQKEQADSVARCKNAVSAWTAAVPEGKSRETWQQLSAVTPGRCLRAGCGPLRAPGDDDE
ncbi:MAG: hypothetical protein IKB22_03715 [Lentisphaeria bacterium]|nr:hypothetical protein [Lentisphaeria bacterium]